MYILCFAIIVNYFDKVLAILYYPYSTFNLQSKFDLTFVCLQG